MKRALKVLAVLAGICGAAVVAYFATNRTSIHVDHEDLDKEDDDFDDDSDLFDDDEEGTYADVVEKEAPKTVDEHIKA